MLLARSFEITTTLCEGSLTAYDCYLPHSTPSPTPSGACLSFGGYDLRNCSRLKWSANVRLVAAVCLVSVKLIPTIEAPQTRSVARSGPLLRRAENADGQYEGTPTPLSMKQKLGHPLSAKARIGPEGPNTGFQSRGRTYHTGSAP